MIDTFDYESPFGWLGRLADALFLEAYMRKFLAERNRYIKREAEQIARAAFDRQEIGHSAWNT